MTRTRLAWLAAVATTTVLTATLAFAQTTPPAGRSGGRAGRAALPPVGVNISQQQLQDYLDTYALEQARRVLVLTENQAPIFYARLQRIQILRRRHMAERHRIMNELVALLNANPAAKAEDIDAHIKALDDAQDALAVDLKKAYLDLDAALTPWQRGRFRQFEEQLERQKIDLLTKIGGGGPAPTPTPTRGRGGL